MKTMRVVTVVIIVLFAMTYRASAQSNGTTKEHKVYLGVGYGFDYGGIGAKVEYLPTPHFGLFGGLGYNLLSAGWNLGATYKILPAKKVSPNLMLFYGYNAVFIGADDYAKKYEKTSYGVTLGVNLDIRAGKKGNKCSIGLFVPIRSSEFKDNYDAAKDDPFLDFKNSLIPVGFSIGYNFGL
jgi:hypothetical protein